MKKLFMYKRLAAIAFLLCCLIFLMAGYVETFWLWVIAKTVSVGGIVYFLSQIVILTELIKMAEDEGGVDDHD